MIQNGPRKILNFLNKDSNILNVGSGPENLGDGFINLDVYPFPEVDIVADAIKLPFRDNSVDGVVSESVFKNTRYLFEMQSLEPRKIKGKIHMITPYRVIGLKEKLVTRKYMIQKWVKRFCRNRIKYNIFI